MVTKKRIMKVTKENYKEIFKKDSYIRKNNYDLFNNGSPVTKIKSVEWRGKFVRINNLNFPLDSLPVILCKKACKNLLFQWNAFGFIPVVSELQEFQCVRQDNGEKKVAIPLYELKPILWSYMKRFPEKKFEAYICPVCTYYHIGKPKSETVLIL